MRDSPSLSPLAEHRRLPTVTDANRHYWCGGKGEELLVLRCACSHWIHPAAASCPACGGTGLHPEAVSGYGTVFSYTQNWHPYNPAVPTPYIVGLVELDEQPGLRLLTNLVNVSAADLAIGTPVQVLFEQHGEIFLPLFEPRAR